MIRDCVIYWCDWLKDLDYIHLFYQVVEYSKVFWERFKELQDSERIESQIEKGEVQIIFLNGLALMLPNVL